MHLKALTTHDNCRPPHVECGAAHATGPTTQVEGSLVRQKCWIEVIICPEEDEEEIWKQKKRFGPPIGGPSECECLPQPTNRK